MSNTNGEQRASETAFFAALRRALANKDYPDSKFGPDYLAQRFLPAHFRFLIRFQGIRKNTRARLDGHLPGLSEYMIARTVYFDQQFAAALKEQIPQIVLLGAGYDTRAYRFAGINQGTRVYELDQPATQQRKRSCLESGGIEIPRQVSLVPIDFNKESLKAALKKAGYDPGAKTLFIWEGVAYYLEAESVDATLDFVARQAHHESRLAFDYTVTLSQENATRFYGATAFAQAMQQHHADEVLMFSLDEAAIEPFLRQRQLRPLEHLDNEAIEKAYLTDDKGTLIGRMTGHFRFVVASPLPGPDKSQDDT